MHDHGVDEQVYHNGSLVSNHCMTFAKKGKDIVSEINKEMKSIIGTPLHVQYFDAFSAALDKIMDPLYEILKVMRSVKKQSPTAIEQFKQNTILLNIAINDLVTKNPVPGADLDIPTFLKSHILFDFHLQDFLETWGSLGAFAEENIESTHPIFNQLLRRYGNTRGWQLKRNVMDKFLIDRSSFVLESVDKMKKSTSKKKRGPNSKKREKLGKVAIVNINTHEDTSLYSPDLTPMEEMMNQNETLHGHEFGDTSLSACAKCGRRVLNFGLPIHNWEYHNGDIKLEADIDVIERMQQQDEC